TNLQECYIKAWYPDTKKSAYLTKTLEGCEDYVWTPDKKLLMGKHGKLFICDPFTEQLSRVIADFTATTTQFYRLAINEAGTKIAGKVSLVVDIDYKGNITKVVVKNGIGYGCDEEAAKVVSMMKFESLRYRGLHVVYHKTINIHFRLPDVKEINPEITYSYK